MWNVKVDHGKCTGCGECVGICPVDVFDLVDDKSAPVNMGDCEGCESCVATCPEEAIVVVEA